MVDVGRQHRRHLAPLHVAAPTLGMEHEDADMLAPRHRLDRHRAGIARCRADDSDVGPAARAEGLEKLAEQLQRDSTAEHTSELQSPMRISYADFCLKKKTT